MAEIFKTEAQLQSHPHHMFVILARLAPTPESSAEVRDSLVALSTLAVEASGALHYVVHQDDAGVLFVYEVYATARERDAHLSRPAVTAFIDRLPDLLVEPARVELAEVLHGTPTELAGQAE